VSYLGEADLPVEQLLAKLEAEHYLVRRDTLPDGRARVRIERHSGRTFHDYRATTTSTAGMETAIRRAYRKLRDAEAVGEVNAIRCEDLAAEFVRRNTESA